MLIHAVCRHCSTSVSTNDAINWVHVVPRLRYCTENGVPRETTAEPQVSP